MNADCHDDQYGEYYCECFEGFIGDGYEGNCQDVDECHQATHFCSDYADCKNTKGSYTCECSDGFFDEYDPTILDFDTQSKRGMNCSNIDECSIHLHNCAFHQDCIDMMPGWRCACRSGYLRMVF